ncbi:DUF4147 domain-containing protein [Sinorhizobium meliloti]|nr:DUF4147 domain-containing protein [Sinorhizobium meliloti]
MALISRRRPPALLPAPPGGLDLRTRSRQQGAACPGAPIFRHECVRKHASRIKGGRLALAPPGASREPRRLRRAPATIRPFVASGPTVADRPVSKKRARSSRDTPIALPERVRRISLPKRGGTPARRSCIRGNEVPSSPRRPFRWKRRRHGRGKAASRR